MARELKAITDAVKPVLSDLGYRRKGNTFYKISDNLAFCIMAEHPGLYYVRFFVIPLYVYQDQVYLTYGDRLKVCWNGIGDGTPFISQVLASIQDEVIPFFNRIDNVPRLLSFLQQDYSCVSPYFFCPKLEISRLRAYTALMLHDSHTFHNAIMETRQLLSATTSFSRNAVAQSEAELCDLERLELSPDSVINQYFQVQIMQNLKKFFPKYKNEDKPIKETVL